MLSEWERRQLDELEEGTSTDDPGLARRLRRPDAWARWRALGRRMITIPALVLVFAVGVTACVLHVGSLGTLLLLWAAVGAVRRVVVHDCRRGEVERPARRPGHRAGF